MTPEELRALAQQQNWSEDFQRFDDATLQGWADKYWDQGAGKFRSMRGAEGYYEKPTECPPGMMPSGPNETDPCVPNSEAGGGGGYGSGGVGGPYGGYNPGGGYNSGGFSTNAPQFNYTAFKAPSYTEAMNDPGYQFSVKEGQKALMGNAAAKGLLRTGGTLKDLMGYGQDRAAQQYGDVYNRALQTWGAQYQGEKDAFAPLYGAWNTQYAGDLSRWTTRYGGDLSKYLQREQNIYGLLNPSVPQY